MLSTEYKYSDIHSLITRKSCETEMIQQIISDGMLISLKVFKSVFNKVQGGIEIDTDEGMTTPVFNNTPRMSSCGDEILFLPAIPTVLFVSSFNAAPKT